MAVIGWLALAFVLASVTLAWGLFALNGLGQYNIGGVPNKASKKLLLLTLAAVIGYAWYWLCCNSPITVSVAS